MDLVCEDLLGEVTCKELKCGDDYVNYFVSMSNIQALQQLIIELQSLDLENLCQGITSRIYQLIKVKEDPSQFYCKRVI